MDSIREYLITVIAAAIICSVSSILISKNTTNAAIIRLLTGIFLSITVISPLANIQLTDLTTYYSNIQSDSETLIAQGENAAAAAAGDIIKERIETYVITKAAAMDVSVTAEVEITGTDPPQPASIKITGTVPPYKKSVLQTLITDELGIPEANQMWM